MAGQIPQDRFPELVAWMYPLLDYDDRENMTRIWQHVMPTDAFTTAVQLVHHAIGDDFEELARRIPGLTPEPETAPVSVAGPTTEPVGIRS